MQDDFAGCLEMDCQGGMEDAPARHDLLLPSYLQVEIVPEQQID